MSPSVSQSYWSIFERERVGWANFAGSKFQQIAHCPSFDVFTETGSYPLTSSQLSPIHLPTQPPTHPNVYPPKPKKQIQPFPSQPNPTQTNPTQRTPNQTLHCTFPIVTSLPPARATRRGGNSGSSSSNGCQSGTAALRRRRCGYDG